MKRLFCLIIFISLTSGTLFAQNAYKVESIPNPKDSGKGYVSDPDKILNQEDIVTLNRLIASLEDSSTAQVAVVIVNSIGEESPKDFTTRLFNHWGIGQADTDNGLLIFTVMNQHRTEFETGYGLEAVLPDNICYRIGMQDLVPEFKKGNYGKGLIAAVTRVKSILETETVVEEIRSTQKSAKDPGILLFNILQIYLLANLVFHLWWLWRLRDMLKSKDDFYDKYVRVRRLKLWGLIIVFPLPFVFVYFFLKKKLKDLRNHPRYSKVTGELMVKLTEEEEDEFLERGQIIEEDIGSVDYDVWVTESGEDVLILKYEKWFSKFKICVKCGFKTFYHAQTKTIRHATKYSTGKKLKRHVCKNCSYAEEKVIIIPRVSSSSGGGGGGSFGGGGSSFGGGSSGGGGAGVSW